MSYLLPNYKRFNLSFVDGEGVYLVDSKGEKYLDFLSGIGVNLFGYGHPLLVKALKKAAEKPWHVSNYFVIKSQEEVAKEIVRALFPAKVFFCNSGAEANEAAIKFARLYGKNFLDGAYKILVAENSFHGRTLATVSATGQEKVRKGFDPLCPGFEFFEFNNLDDVTSKLSDDVAAVMLEPVQGEGGIIPATTEFLYNLRMATREKGILLIVDEIQTGVGRTGDFYAFQGYGVQPDLFTSAKALAGGLPIGAMIVREEISDVMGYGTHGSTFGGNPLITSVALEVVRKVKNPVFLKDIREKSKYFISLLQDALGGFPFVHEIRGKGLMVGVELNVECGEIVKNALKRKLIINCTAGKVLRFLPPLIISLGDMEKGVLILNEVLKEFMEEK